MPLQTMSYWIALMPRILSWSFGIEREELVDVHVRHRERVVGEVDLLLLLVPFDTSGSRRSSRTRSGPCRSGRAPRRPWCARGLRTSRTPPACRRRRTRRRRRRARADRRSAWCAPARCSWRADPRRPPRPRARRCSRAPAGPRRCAQEFMRSQNARLPPFGAGIAQTSTFGSAASMLAKILKPEPRNASLTFCILIGLRRSGLSVPYFAHRLGIGNERKFRRHRLAVGEFLEHAAHHRLDRVEHVLLGDEAHLDIELIELAGRAVGARVLVAEAGRDLEIAVEARHHDELLELLRRLRQRVELAGMDARRHQIVARAFRRRRGQDRRLEFEEALLLHAPADRVDDLRRAS